MEKMTNIERKLQDEIRTKERDINDIKSRLEEKESKLFENMKILEEEISNYKLKIAEHERWESELASQYDKD